MRTTSSLPLLLSILFGKCYAAFRQEDEQLYLQTFDSIIAASYAAVDDLSPDNPNLSPGSVLAECKKSGFQATPTNQVLVVGSDSQTVTASSVASQCGTDTICIIPEGLTLRLDTSLNVGALIIRGRLEWNDETQTDSTQYLCGGYIVVEQDGAFDMEILSDKNGWIYIKDNDAVHDSLRARAFGADAGDGSDHPTITITGHELARTWSLLSEPLLTGHTQMKLLHHPSLMGWKVGDRLGVASTQRLSQGWAQDFRIAAIADDGLITLSEVSTNDFQAEFEAPRVVGREEAALKSAEVVNLSRNIVITGDDFAHVSCDPNLPEAVAGEETSVLGCRCSSFRTKCTVGLHTVQAHGGVSRIQNARVEKCGQRGIEGKYCLHFHKIHECPDCLFKNNAIEYGHQRGIIIHGTHLSTVEGNVLYNVRGAGIYIEDGNEMWNTVSYNTVICPFPFDDETHHGCTVPGTSNRLSDTKDNQSSFYSQSGSNNHIGNRAANSFNGMFLKEGGLGRGTIYSNVCESAARLGRYEGNTFHGHGRFGTYALGSNFPKVTDQSPANNGFNIDKDLCDGFDANGDTRGLPGSFTGHVDYGNAFVGHYSAGDLQYNGHHSTDSNNLMYWKETKNFQNGCGSHIVNGFYARGTLALPDQSSFIIENTVFGDEVLLEANHHCNVGVTGYLCMPQYILHGVRWQNPTTHMPWVQFQNNNLQPHSANQQHGGIFSLSPPDASIVMNGGEIADSFFPPGFVSLVSEKFGYLLDSPNNMCQHSAVDLGSTYANGILCKVPLRALKIYSLDQLSGSASNLRVEFWSNSMGINGQSGPPDAVQEIGFHQTAGDGESNRQGYSVPVIPGVDHSYRISLTTGNLPDDWVIEFSDPVVGNRWGAEFLYLAVSGRQCANNGLISSQHDRKFIYSGDVFMMDEAWGNHGACVGTGTQPADTPIVDCDANNENGLGGLIEATGCPEMCATNCDSQNAYCNCGTGTRQCKPGFAGVNCEVDLCAAARCEEHGTCSAKYLGTSSRLPVTSDKACICDDGWSGPLCDRNPCQEEGKTCSGNGRCFAIGSNAVCECHLGFSGENCDQSCHGLCSGEYPFGCANDVSGKVSLGCDNNGGCSYLGPGENYPHDGYCTYKSSENGIPCDCESESDCQEIGPCLADGSCPALIPRPDGTSCNSVPWGICSAGQCVDSGDTLTAPPTPAPPIAAPNPTPPPTPAPNPTPVVVSRCGCQSCSDEVWNSDAAGHTCGSRIEWLQSPGATAVDGPFDEAEACHKIGQEEYPEICGACSPDECGSARIPEPAPTPMPVAPNPTPPPTPAPNPTPVVVSRCGCQSCTDEIWNSDADGHTCGNRIEWLQSADAVAVGGPYSETEACRKIGQEEYPGTCGTCTPNLCGHGSVDEDCSAICDGEYPFRCATDEPGKVKFGCYPGGMCYYADTTEEAYPWNGFCTYLIKSSVILRTRSLPGNLRRGS